jgi:3' terminal RNA ribose 2'-O-methyltransferase Hen1
MESSANLGVKMLLTIQADISPGSDLGYLLHRHPEQVYTSPLPQGQLHLFYPEVTGHSATAALWLELAPVGSARDLFGNDRPFVVSALMSQAIFQTLGLALDGLCPERPELADKPLNLMVRLVVVASRGGPSQLERLFEPLGYEVQTEPRPLDARFPEWGESPYYTLTLKGHKPLVELLNHLYLLLPVLNAPRHEGLDLDKLEKLLQRAEIWLEGHPDYEWILRQYPQERPSPTRQALERLLPERPEQAELDAAEEDKLEATIGLKEQRLDKVLELLLQHQVQSVVDLGCGEGLMLKRLMDASRIPRLMGIDVSIRELERAERRLLPDWLSERQKLRLQLIQGSVLYRDARYREIDAALLLEVIEHLEPFQLERLTRTLFGEQKPPLVLVSTPNREYNPRFDLPAHELRHRDHRFEWDRREFRQWAELSAQSYGYRVEIHSIGEADPQFGPPAQLALFSRQEAEA